MKEFKSKSKNIKDQNKRVDNKKIEDIRINNKKFRNKRKIEIIIICTLFAAVAGYMDYSTGHISDTTISRNKYGEGDKEVELEIDSKEIKNYQYDLVIEQKKITQKESEEYFNNAIKEIEETFTSNGESLNHVTEQVNLKDKYVNGLVLCEWLLSDYEVIDTDGEVNQEILTEEGKLILAKAELKCEEYKEQYEFYFQVFPKQLTSKESFLKSINDNINNQMEKKGSDTIQLPDSVDGNKVVWKERSQHLFIKVIIFEVIILVLYRISLLEKEKKNKDKLKRSYLLDYPEIVSKLAILVGSGMTIGTAWNRISARYLDDRQKYNTKERPAYEQMVITSREIKDGLSERVAFQKYGEKIGMSQYNRLSRIIVQSIMKGNREICETLEKEAEEALRDRRMLAKKLGEEAGTKMLVPLMMMMGIVIAIVIAPAIIGFKG